MSEANAEDAPPVNFNQYLKTSTARGPRRVTMEEKLRQEQEIAMRESTLHSLFVTLSLLRFRLKLKGITNRKDPMT